MIHYDYINGRKATRQDLLRLWQDLQDGKNKITIHFTKKGKLAVKTAF